MKKNSLSDFNDLTYLLPTQYSSKALLRNEVSICKMEEYLKQLIENQIKLIDSIKKIHIMLSRESSEINHVNLDCLIESIIYMIQNVDNIEHLDTAVHNESKNSFYGNELMLFSIFTSLIQNSITYREKDTLSHWIRIVIYDTEQGKQVMLFDNGKELKKVLQEKVFFSTKQSVSELGGELEISSGANAGTVIICRLPSKGV